MVCTRDECGIKVSVKTAVRPTCPDGIHFQEWQSVHRKRRNRFIPMWDNDTNVLGRNLKSSQQVFGGVVFDDDRKC